MLEERLAVGGMGELFVASTSADRPLSVVKILHRDFLENDEFVAMFEDEGRIGSRLAHPNIVGVHETGKVDDVPFIVFEFIDGENLRTVLRASNELGMPIPAEISARIIVGVLLGLDHAHRARDARGRPLNLVHRDLSPDNIVISWDGEPKILDFGIAKADNRSTQTQVGILKGKSQYMAPEQARLGLVDQRSDLYSAGVVLLELLTGRKRFDFDDPVQQILMAQEWTAYKPSDYAPELPVEMDAIVLKALARAPENRFQTAEAFAVAVTRVLQQGMLPRSEPIASFLRRLFPGRTKRAGLGASDEQTLHPKRRVSTSAPTSAAKSPPNDPIPTAPRTPLPTLRKQPPPVFAPPPASEEPTATRTATGPGVAFEDGDTRASPVWDPEEAGTRATASALPIEDPTDERTRAREPMPPLLAEMDSSSETAPIRRTPAPPAKPVPFTDDVTSDNERPTAKQPPGARREADKPTADDRVPPPIIRPPGSTPRPGMGTGTGAFKLDIGVEEGVYEFDAAAPEKSDGRRAVPSASPSSNLPALKKKKSRRAGVKLLLGVGLVVAGAGAFSEHFGRLERIPQVASAMSFAREKLGLAGEATPRADETPALLLGTAGGMTAPSPAATSEAIASPTPTPTAAPGLVLSGTPEPSATPAASPNATKAPKLDAANALSATIRVTSDPSGFPVLVDGNKSGKKTPATILIAPGDHVISVEAPGFRPWEYEDFFRAGESKSIPAALIPE